MQDVYLNTFLNDLQAAVHELIIALDKQFEGAIEPDGWEYEVVRPIDYYPKSCSDIYETYVQKLFQQPNDLIIEARQNFRNFGIELTRCYLLDLLNQIKFSLEHLNTNFSSVNETYKLEVEDQKLDAGPYIFMPGILTGDTLSLTQMSVYINGIYFNLLEKIKIELPFISLDQFFDKAISTVNSPTQRQRALILHFKETANKKFYTRTDLKKMDNDSLSLYVKVCEVRKGKYSLDDLESAIEYLIDHPAAHKLAVEAFKKKS